MYEQGRYMEESMSGFGGLNKCRGDRGQATTSATGIQSGECMLSGTDITCMCVYSSMLVRRKATRRG